MLEPGCGRATASTSTSGGSRTVLRRSVAPRTISRALGAVLEEIGQEAEQLAIGGALGGRGLDADLEPVAVRPGELGFGGAGHDVEMEQETRCAAVEEGGVGGCREAVGNRMDCTQPRRCVCSSPPS